MKSEEGSVRQVLGQVNQKVILIVLLAVLGTGPRTLSAGINIWTSHGPEGAIIRALAIDPQNPTTIYAGTWN